MARTFFWGNVLKYDPNINEIFQTLKEFENTISSKRFFDDELISSNSKEFDSFYRVETCGQPCKVLWSELYFFWEALYQFCMGHL